MTGLERLVELQPQEYIGKEALERFRAQGVDRKLVGIAFAGSDPVPGIAEPWPAYQGGHEVGTVTAAAWSPGLRRNIGYVWVPIELAEPGRDLRVESEHGLLAGRTAALPFVDPSKERPLQRATG
jgi:glycine cleavage system aminomethyltransferase T